MRKSLLLVFVFLPAILYGWTTPIDISQAPYRSHYADITCDRYDRIHVVWSDEATGNYEIVYRCCVGDSCSIVNISNDSTQSHDAKVAIDTAGNPHVIWVDWGIGYVTGELRYAYYDGENWQEQINLSDTFSMPVSKAGIGTDTLNNIHIVWSSLIGIDEIYYSMNNGIFWSVPAANISNNSEDDFFPSIAIGSKIYVVWMNRGTGASDSLEIYYSEYDTSWSVPVNISNIVGKSRDPQITVDSQRKYPHVVWSENEGGEYSVYYTSCNGGSWTTPYRIYGGWDPVIAVDLQKRIHAVFDSLKNLRYTFGNDTLWSNPVELWDFPGNSLLPALTIDSKNSLHLVFTVSIDGDTSQIYYSKHQLTGIEETESLKLYPCYPNPFHSFTVICYSLSPMNDERKMHNLKIYDISGRIVRTLPITQSPNNSITSVAWNGEDNNGKKVASGVYFCYLRTGDSFASKKIIYLK